MSRHATVHAASSDGAKSTACRFRGYDMAKVDYTLREFTCKGCSNPCPIQEFNVEGEKTYWGDKCSDRYRKRAKTDAQAGHRGPGRPARRAADRTRPACRTPPADAPMVGIPLAMFA